MLKSGNVNGVKFPPGVVIEVSKKESASLIADGSAEVVKISNENDATPGSENSNESDNKNEDLDKLADETPVEEAKDNSEEIKGTEVLKKTFSELKRLSNDTNFIFKGYIEANKIMRGECNVIVTDGFTGNIALKTAEGTAKFLTDNLKSSLTENIFSKISLIFSFFALKKFKSKLDPRKYNGAIFLGLNGPVVKSHGGTDSVGFYYSIDLCYRIIKGNLIEEIQKNLSHLDAKD